MVNIDSDSVFTILRGYFGRLVGNNQAFNLITTIADQSYRTVDDINWLRDMILHDPVLSPSRYRRDIFDCDDYVMYTKTKISLFATNNVRFSRPIAVGFILTEAHAFNFGIDNEGKLYIVNTQSDDINCSSPASVEECKRLLGLNETNHLKIIYI